jgi:hypothetical protein
MYRLDLFAVERNRVVIAHVAGERVDFFAVYLNASVQNELFRLAARCGSAKSQIFIDAQNFLPL